MVTRVKRAKAEVCRSKPMVNSGVSCSQRKEMDRSDWMKMKIDSANVASVVMTSTASRSPRACFGDKRHTNPNRNGKAIG